MQGWWNDTVGENRCNQEKNYSIVTLTTTDLAWTGLKSNCHFHGGWLSWICIIHKCQFVPYREHSGSPLQRPTGECYI